MVDVNKYVGIPYDAKNFNCWHLATVVMSEVFDIELPDMPDTADLEPFCDRIDKPEVGCLVLMYNHLTHEANHIGVCVGTNDVLHCIGSNPTSVINRITSCRQAFWKLEYYAVRCHS